MQKLKAISMSLIKNKLLYTIIVYTFFACISYLNPILEIVQVLLVIAAPLYLNDTDTLSMYVYSACFMNCYTIISYFWILCISTFVLEIKKIYIAIKYNQDFKQARKVIISWLVLAIILTIYSFIYNRFHVYRMSVFIDFIQCFLLFYLVKDNIDLKKVVVIWSYGIIVSVVVGFLFHYTEIYSNFIKGVVGNRFGAFFCNINSLSVHCIVCSACLITLSINKKLNKIFLVLPFCITILGLATYSKAFIVISLMIYLFWFIYSIVKAEDKQDFIANSLFILSASIIMVGIYHQYFIDMFNRFFGDKSNGLLDSITTGRVSIWYKYIKQWLDNPISILFGNGYASPKIDTNQYEHCLYIAFLNRFGIIGSIIIVTIMVWTVIKDGANKTKLCNYLPLFAILVYGLVDNVSGVLFTFLPLCLCLLIIIKKDTKQ